MFNQKQILFTLFSMAICATFAFILWQIAQENEYTGMAAAINLVIAYIAGVLMGFIGIINRPYKSAVGFYNFIGTYNLCLVVGGSIFVYVDNDHQFSAIHIVFIFPLVIALYILEHVYFSDAEDS